MQILTRIATLVITASMLSPAIALQADDKGPSIPDGFKTPETIESFRTAVELFERGEFSEAQKTFKKAGKGAKGDAKASVKSYEKACKGAKDLTKIEKELARSRWQNAQAVLRRVEAKYGATPLSFHLEQLRKEIDENLYLVLTDFEEEPSPFERPVLGGRPQWGTSLIKDPRFVRSGKSSFGAYMRLKRGQQRDGGVTFGRTYPIVRFDPEWRKEHGALSLWVYSISKEKEEIMIYLTESDSGALDNMGSSAKDLRRAARCLHVTQEVPPGRWHEIRVNLDRDFTNQFKLKWEDLKTLCIGYAGKTYFRFYMDSLRLERR